MRQQLRAGQQHREPTVLLSTSWCLPRLTVSTSGKGTRRAVWRRALAPVTGAGEEESGKHMVGMVEDTTEPTTGAKDPRSK